MTRSHVAMRCALWGENVDAFLSQRDSQMIVPIVLVQFCKASRFNGQIRCGTVYNASKVCLNKDISVINQFRQRIMSDDSFSLGLPDSLKYDKPMVMDESFSFGCIKCIDTLFCLEDGTYWICARVESVSCYGEWFYICCQKCGKKVEKTCNEFHCIGCSKFDGSGIMRYMLKFEVFDGTSTAELVLWDKECVQILQKKASELDCAQVVSPNNVPKEIEDCVVGKIFLFKVALRNEDDFLHLKPYNVKKVITDVALIEKYSVNVVANLEASKTAATYEDMYLNECSTLSQIVDFPDLGSDVDSLKVFGDKFLSPSSSGVKNCLVVNLDDVSMNDGMKENVVMDLDVPSTNCVMKDDLVINLDVFHDVCPSVERKKSGKLKREEIETTPGVKRKLVGDFEGSVKDSKNKLVAVKLEPTD
ncbi:uncharacterized protein LOC125216922 [Salvia hispanica]|uniref:uncharacterized protein LOC125216922 n=1 Tax=Salvia hispanica TaxID=49212 RepID=UPI00200929BA|nr:uncharacterized protein LOC125216922 [Salvia hispanica]